jgi:hypothetical protein
LSQASLPLHAQITHGAWEYGKDIIAVEQTDGKLTVKMYQAKTGDISLSDWRKAYPQLEEMFLVDLPEFVVPSGMPVERKGYLCTNGHVMPAAFPVVDAWLKSQLTAFGRDISIIDIDRLVRWINEDHLLQEFRLALRDEALLT